MGLLVGFPSSGPLGPGDLPLGKGGGEPRGGEYLFCAICSLLWPLCLRRGGTEVDDGLSRDSPTGADA